MKFLFFHHKTLAMNLLPDGSLRWQRFTGIVVSRWQIGSMVDCDIDDEAALKEIYGNVHIAVDYGREIPSPTHSHGDAHDAR